MRSPEDCKIATSLLGDSFKIYPFWSCKHCSIKSAVFSIKIGQASIYLVAGRMVSASAPDIIPAVISNLTLAEFLGPGQIGPWAVNLRTDEHYIQLS